MPKFRKKPVVIEAVQATNADFNGFDWDGRPFRDMEPWVLEAIEEGVLEIDISQNTDYARWRVKTLEGDHTGGPGDWLIRGVKGELYFCKPDIFEATYEAVE